MDVGQGEAIELFLSLSVGLSSVGMKVTYVKASGVGRAM